VGLQACPPLAALMVLAACIRPTALPVFGQIPQFELTAQTGQPFDSHTLDGHIWIANFVFTTCPGPCPMMTHQMHGIQESTSSTPSVKLISFTVDPEHDTPPVLASYANHFKADPARWTFLTGDIARLNDLGLNAFKLNKVDGSLDHSTRFVLIDTHRRIRGFYLASDDEFPKNLLRDLRQLQRQAS
jgi:protein SCO1/2